MLQVMLIAHEQKCLVNFLLIPFSLCTRDLFKNIPNYMQYFTKNEQKLCLVFEKLGYSK